MIDRSIFSWKSKYHYILMVMHTSLPVAKKIDPIES